jgi:hypothetical protein
MPRIKKRKPLTLEQIKQYVAKYNPDMEVDADILTNPFFLEVSSMAEEYKKDHYDITNDPEFLAEKAKVDLEHEVNSWLEIVHEVISGKKVNFRDLIE